MPRRYGDEIPNQMQISCGHANHGAAVRSGDYVSELEALA